MTVQSWSTGEYREWYFDTRRKAFAAIREFKPSYFDQVFYIRQGNRRSHRYTLPAFCTFEEFLENIMNHVRIVQLTRDVCLQEQLAKTV